MHCKEKVKMFKMDYNANGGDHEWMANVEMHDKMPPLPGRVDSDSDEKLKEHITGAKKKSRISNSPLQQMDGMENFISSSTTISGEQSALNKAGVPAIPPSFTSSSKLSAGQPSNVIALAGR